MDGHWCAIIDVEVELCGVSEVNCILIVLWGWCWNGLIVVMIGCISGFVFDNLLLWLRLLCIINW